MTLAEGIRRRGFRKWYERELLQSHAHLVLGFLCLIGIFAAVELLLTPQPGSQRLTALVAFVVCVGGGLWALRRYALLLGHAELAASQADCPQCKTYGRLDLLQSDASGEQVQVRCRQCSHAWRIEL